nr:hypothetical protein [Mesorhizobium sp.]
MKQALQLRQSRAARTRSGINGKCVSSVPSASFTALTTAAATGCRDLAYGFGAEGAGRLTFFDQQDTHRRHLACIGQGVAAETVATHPASDAVDRDILVERITDTDLDSFMDLALHQHRVDRSADVMGGKIIYHLHTTCEPVDLPFRKMRGV